MLSGVNLEATVALARAVKIPVIASGGVATMEDIERLCSVQVEGVEAAVLGRSLYEGTLDFRVALERADREDSE
jgi:phosphoribosylformimino-5-aminoimidazole carboxamide ribotide isomerase